jgi:aminopeptidase-like protein
MTDLPTDAAIIGQRMHEWATDLFSIHRSLTGDGVRATLSYFARLLPGLRIHEVPSGTPAFDWTVPDEWNCRAAWIEDEAGHRVVDLAHNTLHVVQYSEPVDRWLSLDELQPHLHSLPHLPEAIPYVTSYYNRTWGFCLTERARRRLAPGRYRAVVDATLAPGSLTYGEMVLPGREEREIFLSTYVCHPQMANNELSGPVLAVALGRWLADLNARRYTYRIVFVPETVGALVYLSRHLNDLRRNVDAGFMLTCVGDERAWSYIPSRYGDTLADRVIRHWSAHRQPGVRIFDFMDRGSDERQYCSPGADLPVAGLMRSKYYNYPEYHTSLDDLSLITPHGLGGSFAAHREMLAILEGNEAWRVCTVGEPQLGRRGLYPPPGTHGAPEMVNTMLGLLAYADGSNDLIGLAERVGRPALDCLEILRELERAEVVERLARPIPRPGRHTV